MRLPDPDRSQAVLIGSSQFETLEALPAVRNNVAKLADVLADPELWGLPSDHIHVLCDPGSPSEVLRTVDTAARRAEDTLIVYFAGHGLRDPETFELYLALPVGDRPDALHEAIRYDDIRRAVVRVSRAASKVVVLDCCYSGMAMVGGMSGAAEVADQARLAGEGTYLMTASAATSLALAEPGEQYTAFTGELIDALDKGIAGGPELIDMGSLYGHVYAALWAKLRPRPQERAQNRGRAIAVARNRQAGTAAAAAGHLPGEQPERRYAPASAPGASTAAWHQSAESHSDHGDVMLARLRYKEAEAAYRSAVALSPNSIRAHAGLAQALSGQGHHDEAEAESRRALAIAPDSALAHVSLGEVMRGRGRYSEAEIACRQAISLEPGRSDSHCGLGEILAAGKRTREAEAAYREASAWIPAASAHTMTSGFC